jgi:polysaccharide biosynthesis transport protein
LTVATAPLGPSSPKLLLNLLIGAFLGGVLGVATALFQETMHPRVRLDEDLLRLLGVPILAKVGHVTVGAMEAGARGPSPAVDSPSI